MRTPTSTHLFSLHLDAFDCGRTWSHLGVYSLNTILDLNSSFADDELYNPQKVQQKQHLLSIRKKNLVFIVISNELPINVGYSIIICPVRWFDHSNCAAL